MERLVNQEGSEGAKWDRVTELVSDNMETRDAHASKKREGGPDSTVVLDNCSTKQTSS